jgi:cellulose synthase/poly-beta-1,6-N-acetylglucosamine synthase-like glycosyltransferase
VPGIEPLDMLEETVTALVAMGYPHETWVLDEGDDETVRGLCARLGVRHFTRLGRPEYQTAEGRFQARTKHGNYNAWLAEEGFKRYDVIVAFDPDHVPRPTYLQRVLGYFDDPAIGYVQPAQVYYNQDASFVARGAAEETYAYYSSHQMASHALGHPIVTGCHNAHRKTALQAVGGLAPHDADDLLITLLYRAAGWRGVYVPEVLASGLTPVDWDGYLAQQRRWARSVLDVKLHAYPRLAGRLPFKEKVLSALHGVYYLRGLGTLVGYGMLAWLLLGGTLPQALSMTGLANVMLLFLVLHLTGLYRQRFYLDPGREAGVHWRAGVLQMAKWPFLLAAVADVVAGRRLAYAVTRKNRAATRRHLIARPHWLIAIAIAAAWAVGAASGHAIAPVTHAWAAFIVMGSLVLVWTDHRPFPPPYERARFATLRKAGSSSTPGGAARSGSGAMA